jgi:hypothetical protein
LVALDRYPYPLGGTLDLRTCTLKLKTPDDPFVKGKDGVHRVALVVTTTEEADAAMFKLRWCNFG